MVLPEPVGLAHNFLAPASSNLQKQFFSGENTSDRAAKMQSRKGRRKVRKKLMVLVMVGLAFVLLAGPVLAAGSGRDAHWAVKQGPKRKAHVISMTGTILSATCSAISVDVQMTNKPFLVKRGQQVQVDTTSNPVYVIWENPRIRTRDCSLVIGYLSSNTKVSINARVTTIGTTTTITARRVEVKKPRYR
jgi:hypothetical protein